MPGDEYIPAVLVPSQADIARRIQREEASAQRVALSAIGDQLGAFADEIKGLVQAPRVLSPIGGDIDMAEHRMRICVGYNDDGSVVTQRVRADSEIEMADKIVRIMLQSPRRAEFLPDDYHPAAGAPTEATASAPTLRDYTEEWRRTYKDGKQRQNTRDGISSYLRVHIYPTWGDTPIDQIATKDIQEFMNARSHLAAKTLREMLNLLKQVFSSAVEDGLIPTNPAKSSRLSNPGKASKNREALDRDTLAEIAGKLHLLEENDRRFLALAMYTGMRRGEIVGLRWEDIDLANNVIHVQRSANINKGKAIIGETKTASGKRDIPIAPDLLSNLKPLKATGYVIVGTRDQSGKEPITCTIYVAMLKRINKVIDMHGATAHVFRHSLGTLLYDASQNVKTVQSIMGHSDFKTTTDRYVHAVDERKQTAIQQVGSLITHQTGEPSS